MITDCFALIPLNRKLNSTESVKFSVLQQRWFFFDRILGDVHTSAQDFLNDNDKGMRFVDVIQVPSLLTSTNTSRSTECGRTNTEEHCGLYLGCKI
jgi:hypothetical protein